MFANETTAFDAENALRQAIVVSNAKGMHARASAKFVQTAERFDADVAVRCRGQTVNGRSIMGLMMLCASQGTEIEIAAAGQDAAASLAALSDLVTDGFGETDDGGA